MAHKRISSIRSLVIGFLCVIFLAPSNTLTITLEKAIASSEEARNTCLKILTNVTIDQIDLSHFIHGSDVFLFHLLDCKVSGLQEYQVVPSSTSNVSKGKLHVRYFDLKRKSKVTLCVCVCVCVVNSLSLPLSMCYFFFCSLIFSLVLFSFASLFLFPNFRPALITLLVTHFSSSGRR